MCDKAHTARYEVNSSTREELNEGWIWIRNKADTKLKNELEGCRRIIRINHSNHIVYCEALYVSDNDLNWFKQRFETKKSDVSICECQYADLQRASESKDWDNKNLIFINQWYRQRLGIKEVQSKEVQNNEELTINTQSKICWQIKACLQHPQIVVRLSTILGIISVALGIIAILIGCITITQNVLKLLIGIFLIICCILVIICGTYQIVILIKDRKSK